MQLSDRRDATNRLLSCISASALVWCWISVDCKETDVYKRQVVIDPIGCLNEDMLAFVKGGVLIPINPLLIKDGLYALLSSCLLYTSRCV